MNTIFVSSTFRDMNGERDVIRQKVVPLLNVTAMKYGESIWCKDLRWGIDTTDLSEKEANTKVLGVCLDEIDRSNPPFVILLGERYGWIPGRAQIRSEAERKRMELKDLEISVTALEIEYGVFSRKYTPLVYFRETSGRVPKEMKAEELAHRIKLEALKARLRKLCGDKIRTYRVRFDASGPRPEDLDSFADLLTKDICNVMVPQWERFSRLSSRQKEITIQQRYLAEKVKQYAPASSDEDTIYNTLIRSAGEHRDTISPYEGLFLYQNDEGTGKSMLFARIAQRLEEDPQNIVFASTVGLTSASSNAGELLRSEVYMLENYINSPHFEEEDGRDGDVNEYRKRLEDLCEFLTANGRKLFFLVDGVEKLNLGADRDRLVFLPASGIEGISMLLTARKEYSFPLGRKIEPERFTYRERHIALNGLLSYYGQELSDRVKHALIMRSQKGGVLYMSMLLKRLQQMSERDFSEINRRGGSNDAIAAYQEELLEKCPGSADELAYQLLENIGNAINPEMVMEALSLLSMSPFGLRESDLAAMMKERFNSLDLAALIRSWEECFLIMPDGRIMFRIGCAAKGCYDRAYLSDCDRLYLHVEGLDERDEFRKRYLLYFAREADCLTRKEVLRYVSQCTEGTDNERHASLEQAAYMLWMDGFEEQIIAWIKNLQTMTEADQRFLPAFLDLWSILMVAEDYYHTDPAYEWIVKTYRASALALEEKYRADFGDSIALRADDCMRVLADYYAEKGDLKEAAKYRESYILTLEEESSGPEQDAENIPTLLSTLSTQLNDYAARIDSGDRGVIAEADPVRDRIAQMCREKKVQDHFPQEALIGLVALERYELAVHRLRGSDFSVAGEVEALLGRHPELEKDKVSLQLLVSFFSQESSRLSHALKGEKIPEDRLRQAISYSMAAQRGCSDLIREEPTQERCMALAGQKLNTARLLEQLGTGEAMRRALDELLDGAAALARMKELPGTAVIEPMFGFTLYNRMGIIAAGIGGQKMKNIIETAFNNSIAYATSLPDSPRNFMIMAQIFQNQAQILEKTGQAGHLEMAELRYRICSELIGKLMSGEILSQLPPSDRSVMKNWKKEIDLALKQVRKRMR